MPSTTKSQELKAHRNMLRALASVLIKNPHIIILAFAIAPASCAQGAVAADDEWLGQLRAARTSFVEQRRFVEAVNRAEKAFRICEESYPSDSWQPLFAKIELDSYRRAVDLPWSERRHLDETLDMLGHLRAQTDVHDWSSHVAQLEASISSLERFIGGQCWLLVQEYEYLDAIFRKTGSYDKCHALAEKRFRSMQTVRGREDPILAMNRLSLARWDLASSPKLVRFSQHMKNIAAYRTKLPADTQLFYATLMTLACEESGLVNAALTWSVERRKLTEAASGFDDEMAEVLAKHARLQMKLGMKADAAATLSESSRYAERSVSKRGDLPILTSLFHFDIHLVSNQRTALRRGIEQLEAMQEQRCETFPLLANSRFAAELIVRRGLAEEQLGEFSNAKVHLIQGLTQWRERAQGDLPGMMDGMLAIVRVCNHLDCSDEAKGWESARRTLEQKTATHRSELLALTATFNKGDSSRKSTQTER